MPSILKSSDISRLLEVSPDDISLLARRGFLKGFKIGRQWRFKRKDILFWIRKYSRNEILNQMR
ncbi:helix-turn-helix domain-containing protein [Thermodesulfobacteriota bacterium]